jgi:carbon-monoxide dehydrogenase medium subunit
LEEGEVVTEVRFPVPEKSHYEKFVQPASRFALVGVMVAKYADGVRVAVTGASESGVFRWTEAEAALSANFTADALGDLSLDGDGMIADLHGSGAYRAHLVKVMTGRALKAAI